MFSIENFTKSLLIVLGLISLKIMLYRKSNINKHWSANKQTALWDRARELDDLVAAFVLRSPYGCTARHLIDWFIGNEILKGKLWIEHQIIVQINVVFEVQYGTVYHSFSDYISFSTYFPQTVVLVPALRMLRTVPASVWFFFCFFSFFCGRFSRLIVRLMCTDFQFVWTRCNYMN